MKKLVIFGAAGFAQEVLWTVNEMNKIALFGAGGFAKSVLWTIQDAEMWEVVGFIDEINPGREYCGYPVMAPDDPRIEGCCLAHGVGDGRLKKRVAAEYGARGFRFANIIHPSVIVGLDAEVAGEGNVIQAGTILAPHSRVMNHVTLNLRAIVGHDSIVHDYATISPQGGCMGNCVVGEGAMIGAGAVVREKIHVGEWSVIGINAAVVRDVPHYTVVGGVPAKQLRQVNRDV